MRVVDTVAHAYASAVDRQGPCVPVDLDNERRGREHADRVGEQVLMTIERLRQDLLEAAARVDRNDLAVDAAADVDRHVVPLSSNYSEHGERGSTNAGHFCDPSGKSSGDNGRATSPTTGPIFAPMGASASRSNP